MSDDSYPRVLFVTPHAFNHLTGGGVTFSNLFRGWPRDRLATVHCDHIPTTDDVCNHYFRLGKEELDVWWPIRKCADALRWRSTAEVASTPSGGDVPAPLRPSWTRRVQSLFFEAELPRSASLSPALEQWISDFRPEVIYTILGSNGMMDLVERIRVRFGLPMVIHIMDDWASSRHCKGLFEPLLRQGMERRLQNMFGAAVQRMAVCPAMCEAYGNRYDLAFVPFQNAIDHQRWQPFCRANARASGAGDILYVGSVLPNAQLQSLIDCCHAVVSLSNSGCAASLTIAAPKFLIEPVRHLLDIHPAIRIVAPIEDDETFYRRIAVADILLLPVNFDENSTRFIRYSMPTKVPAYLFSGTPVLVYGPADTAQTQYALNDSWGLVQARPDRSELADAMLRLLSDEALRQKFSETAKRLARDNHDQVTVRRRFQDELAFAAGYGE